MHKKLYFSLLGLFLIFASILFSYGVINYYGNKLIYILFSIVFNYALIFSFKKNTDFFDIFFSLLIWLGFWFKFTVQISFLDYQFPEGTGTFDFNNESFDDVLIISSFCCFSYLFARILKLQFFKKSEYKSEYKKDISFQNFKFFYLKNRNKILFLSFIFIILFCILNYFAGFYQKGVVQNILPYKLNYLFNWFLNFGFASFFSFIIFFEYANKLRGKIDPMYLGLAECFVSSFSQLSRGMIFNGLSLIIGLLKIEFFKKSSIDLKKYFFYFITLVLLFLISVYSVNILRGKKGYNMAEIKKFIEIKPRTLEKSKENLIIKEFSKETNQIIFLISGRWVGIEGLMSTYAHSEKGMKLLKESLQEEFNFSNSFYETRIKKHLHVYDKNATKLYTVYTPGLFGYLYYAGSYFFLFISIFTVVWLCYLIEYLVRRLSYDNLVFSSLIGNILAYRLAHFGYMPLNSYKLLIAIFANLLIYHLIIRLINKDLNENIRT